MLVIFASSASVGKRHASTLWKYDLCGWKRIVLLWKESRSGALGGIRLRVPELHTRSYDSAFSIAPSFYSSPSLVAPIACIVSIIQLGNRSSIDRLRICEERGSGDSDQHPKTWSWSSWGWDDRPCGQRARLCCRQTRNRVWPGIALSCADSSGWDWRYVGLGITSISISCIRDRNEEKRRTSESDSPVAYAER